MLPMDSLDTILRKSLFFFFTYEKLKFFCNIWSPCKDIAINEGTVPVKDRILFKYYNPNKQDKYGIKTFKVCDPSA